MSKYGLLIDTNWCTGCHSCEVACQVEHDLPIGQYGIKLAQVGPWEIAKDKWQDAWVPVPTAQCDACAARLAAGKLPTCVQHCQAKCMEFGPVSELAASIGSDKGKALFVL